MVVLGGLRFLMSEVPLYRGEIVEQSREHSALLT